MIPPAPPFTHLRRLTDAGGLHEHARLTCPRPEHGYCVDDVARGLVVVCREQPGTVDDLREQYLSFVLGAQAADGRFRNRRGADLGWLGEPSVEDCWGRALWGLGWVVSSDPGSRLGEAALAGFEQGARWRSPWSRAMAFAALGAAQVHQAWPRHAGAIALLAAAAESLNRPPGTDWRWPEPRLSYANAAVPEALLAAGAALDRPRLIADGLDLLGWLLEAETLGDHLSVTPVGGRGPGEQGPGFDQQPIEVAALAEACGRAHVLTGDVRWSAGVDLATAWFLGGNDSGTALHDAISGGGCDGLERDGRNENQGAESTLAWISTLQQARALASSCP